MSYCTCPEDGSAEPWYDEACPFHGKDGSMVVLLCARCYHEGRAAIAWPCKHCIEGPLPIPTLADKAFDAIHDHLGREANTHAIKAALDSLLDQSPPSTAKGSDA